MRIIAVLFTIVLLFSGCVQTPVEETTTVPATTVPATTVPATTVPAERGPASDAVVFREIADEKVVQALLSGEMDYCLTSLTPDQALELEDSREVKLYYASSQIEGIIMNPAPAPEGELNPFSLQEVRFAMQYLIDRGSIVDEVHKGFATPIITNINPEHPGYEVIRGVVEEYGIVHDSEKASAMIEDAMVAAGAKMVDGSWEYDGQPVVIKALVSAEEGEFRDMGELVSSALEDEGFSVERVYLERGDESPTYYSDPAELQWHLSITGWIYYGFSRYQEVSFPEPYNKDGWWQYENEEIERLKDGLDNYSSEAEWEQTNRELARAYIEDSVSIWLTSKKNVFAARTEVEGLTEDKFVGLRSYGNVRQAHVPGKGTLVIGNRYTYETEDSWNPVVVEGIYMMDILNSIHDPMTWSDPEDLSKGPFRWDYSIETEGPGGKMGVPSDAFIWDVDDKVWVSVGEDVESRSRVTYDLSKYVGTNWHHGAEIGWADVLYFTASMWDLSYDEGKQEMSSDTWKKYFEPIRGLRIQGNKLEVYTDRWSFSEEEFLGFAGMFQRVAPWEIYAAGNEVVFQDKALVYNKYEMPEGLDVPAMSLVNESHIGIMLGALDGLEYADVEPFVTAGGTSYATGNDLQKRVKAVHGWYDGHGNLIISDGPFYLDRYNADGSVELKAFRDPSYPFEKGERYTEGAFEQFLDDYESRVVGLSSELGIAYFDASISGRAQDYEKSAELEIELTKVYADKEDFARLRAFKESGAVEDEILKRQLDIIYNYYLGSQVEEKMFEERINLQTDIEKRFNAFRTEVDGKELTDNDVEDILDSSLDSEELKAVWMANKEIGGLISEDLIRLVRMRNAEARELGFDNYHEMSLILKEQDPEEIERVFDELDELTRESYEGVKVEIDDALARRYNVTVEQLMPWHYQDRFFQMVPNIYEVDFDKYYADNDVVALTRDYYAGIGLPIDDIIGGSDLYEKEGKYQHAYCTDIDREGDVRVVANIKQNSKWMSNTLHEYGHGVYFKFNDRELPWTLRTHAHTFTTEAVALMFGRLAYSPAWLQEVVGISNEEREAIEDSGRMRMRSDELILSRWMQVMYRFEKSMYEDPEQDLNKLWWDLVGEYQLLKRPDGRNEADWASKVHILMSPAYYHNYMLGDLLTSQLYYHICEDVLEEDDCSDISFAGREEVGKYLIENVFMPGKRYQWNEMIERATGEKLTAKYFARQYVSD